MMAVIMTTADDEGNDQSITDEKLSKFYLAAKKLIVCSKNAQQSNRQRRLWQATS